MIRPGNCAGAEVEKFVVAIVVAAVVVVVVRAAGGRKRRSRSAGWVNNIGCGCGGEDGGEVRKMSASVLCYTPTNSSVRVRNRALLLQLKDGPSLHTEDPVGGTGISI